MPRSDAHRPPSSAELVPLGRVREARTRLGNRIHLTPVMSSRALGERVGCVPLWLKCENLQKTGSFKARGALNRLLTLAPEARERGVVTISAGNHAQALAWAASAAGVRSAVVMPEGASPTKAAASRAYGAEVIMGGPVAEAFDLAHRLADERGMTFVHPFDDPEIVAGQGTVGLELVEQVPELSVVVVPVGGGGQIAGICAAISPLAPDVRIFGVEPEGAAAMRRSLDLGEPTHIREIDTIADGLAPPMAGVLNFAHVRAQATDVITVPDALITEALELLLSRTKLLVEPAGAAAVAGLLSGKIPLPEGGAVAAILSGGNVDLDRLGSLLSPGS